MFLTSWQNASMERLIDSSTGDYTGTRTTNLANAVYLRLMVPLGSYWANPLLGSKLHLLRREKDVNRVNILARQYAEEALAPLTADGNARAKSVTVDAMSASPGWLILQVTVIQSDDSPVTFRYPVRVA